MTVQTYDSDVSWPNSPGIVPVRLLLPRYSVLRVATKGFDDL